ncbi:MAG: TrmH family RNA methyltransferase [Polyangiaceae bacterium]|jgi:tRNA (guanosine-2'-O-)-methyltransferase
MRRRTPGVLTADELLDPQIVRAETERAAEVVRALEPLTTERRRARVKGVIDRRLASVGVLFDAPHDPHNGAAVIRSCEAFGVQSLHVVERVERFLAAASVARSAEQWIDVVCHKTADSAVAAVKRARMEMVAAHPDGELMPEELAAIPRVAIVLGNERDGISEDLAARCSRRVRVPMRGFVESLNVSVTAAILLASATRGREGDLDEEARLRLYARGLYYSIPRAGEVLAEMGIR